MFAINAPHSERVAGTRLIISSIIFIIIHIRSVLV